MAANEPPTTVDSSVLIPALVQEHQHHALATLAAAHATSVLGPVVVEVWSVLRRWYGFDVDTVSELLDDYISSRALVGVSAEVYEKVLSTGRSLNLAGNIHDAVIVRICEAGGLALSTLDRGMRRLADGTVHCTLLEPND